MTQRAQGTEPVRSRFIDVGGIRTHYLDAGDGPVVVLLHSGEFGASAELSWEYNIQALARHFRVIAPDWLGFGETDKLRDFVHGSERVLRHMAAFLEILAVAEADFVGVSMGGTNLLRESARRPCRFPIKNMVVVSGGGLLVNNASRRATLQYNGTHESMRSIMAVNFADPTWIDDDEYIQRRVAASLAPGAWEALASARLTSPTAAPRSEFGGPDLVEYESIPYRTLAVAGGKDQLREPGFHRAFHRMPNSRVVVLDDAGHLLNIEKSEVLNDLLIQFLHGNDLSDVAEAG